MVPAEGEERAAGALPSDPAEGRGGEARRAREEEVRTVAGVESAAPVPDLPRRSRIRRSRAGSAAPEPDLPEEGDGPRALSEEGDGPRAPARRPASVAVAGVPRARLGPAGGRVLGRGGRASGLRGRERKIMRDLEKQGRARDLGSVAGDGQSRKRVRWQAHNARRLCGLFGLSCSEAERTLSQTRP